MSSVEGAGSPAGDPFFKALEASPQAVLLADNRGKILYVNAVTVNLFGFSEPELLGASVEKLIPGRFQKAHGAHMHGFMDNPRARSMGPSSEVFGMRKDGRELPVEIALGPFEVNGQLRVIAFITDISVRKHTEARIQQQTAALDRSNQDLESFAYAASHDLQEPLRAVMGYLQLIQRQFAEALPDKAADFLAKAMHGGNRMKDLMDALLQYSRTGLDQTEQEIDLQSMVNEIIRDFHLLIEESQAEIQIGSLPTVRYNAVELRQIFQNLIGNALKFRAKDRPPKIRVGYTEGVFSISDNGIGIAAEYHGRLFQLFQRLHDRGTYPGSGIGLALVGKAIRSSGGRIWLESKPGEGSTFYFTLQSKHAQGEAHAEHANIDG